MKEKNEKTESEKNVKKERNNYSKNSNFQIISKFKSTIWYICGLLEMLFAFRLFLKVFGANPNNAFVQGVYNISGIFLEPFSGIFSSTVGSGAETKAVFEPTVIVAMFVYMVLTYSIIRLIEIYQR